LGTGRTLMIGPSLPGVRTGTAEVAWVGAVVGLSVAVKATPGDCVGVAVPPQEQGVMVGVRVGEAARLVNVGVADGLELGLLDGVPVRVEEGDSVREGVGVTVGENVGEPAKAVEVGEAVGLKLGLLDGVAVTVAVKLGVRVGVMDGEAEGVGDWVGVKLIVRVGVPEGVMLKVGLGVSVTEDVGVGEMVGVKVEETAKAVNVGVAVGL